MPKKMLDGIALSNEDGEIVYYSPRVRPSQEDNPALYKNVQPVFKWNKERTELVKVGERDVDKEIQDASIGITPYELQERCQRLGDDSLMNVKQGFYADVTGAPETLGEACDLARGLDVAQESIEKKGHENVQSKVAPKPANGVGGLGGGGVDLPSENVEKIVPAPASQTTGEGKEKEK